jgi:hypothetical protein
LQQLPVDPTEPVLDLLLVLEKTFFFSTEREPKS